jgi:hypothetical protein
MLSTLILTEVFWDKIFAVVHDEDPSHVQFDVVPLLFVLKQVEWGSFWYKEQCPELQLTFHREVLQENV